MLDRFDATPPAGPDTQAPGFNCGQYVQHWARLTPGARAVRQATGGDTGLPALADITYAQLDTETGQLAHALQARGIAAGDRVLVFCTGGLDFVRAVYGCLKLGAVPVLIDPGMGLDAMLTCIAEQEARGIIGVPKAMLLRAVKRAAFKSVRVAIRVGSGWFPGVPHVESVMAKAGETGAAFSPVPRAPDDVAVLVYTSGSTGVPKGVPYTTAMMTGQVTGVGMVGGFVPGEVHVACFPGFALYTVALGMTCVFPDMDFAKVGQTPPHRVLNTLRAAGAESAFASPAVWTPVAGLCAAGKSGAPITTLRTLHTAGAPISPVLLDALAPAFPSATFFTPYGATESLPVAAIGSDELLGYAAPKTAQGWGKCVGRAVGDVDVRLMRITDDDVPAFTPDLEVPPGAVGEIVVSGTVVTTTYDRRPGKTAGAKMRAPDGTLWHRMGDLGRIEDGRLWFLGRKTHRVPFQGKLYTSETVEAVFETHPAVPKAALAWRALPAADGALAREPVLAIDLQGADADTLDLAALREFADQHEATRGIHAFLLCPGADAGRGMPAFSYDRRHNAKIEREKLAAYIDAHPAAVRR